MYIEKIKCTLAPTSVPTVFALLQDILLNSCLSGKVWSENFSPNRIQTQHLLRVLRVVTGSLVGTYSNHHMVSHK